MGFLVVEIVVVVEVTVVVGTVGLVVNCLVVVFSGIGGFCVVISSLARSSSWKNGIVLAASCAGSLLIS